MLGADGTYDLTQPGDPTETALVPDVSFCATGRLPTRGTPNARGYAKLAPDLVAEVASPSQYRQEMGQKAHLYVTRGVRLHWLIWPNRQEVDVWQPSSPDAPVTTLTLADILDGLDVVPGFMHALVTLPQCRVNGY